ncbi:hypothetical protein SAMN05216604_14417 [Pseudomonas agarici]|nr:hypothetical protein SAMN05216604_14417 [Pseudomonas agarici]
MPLINIAAGTARHNGASTQDAEQDCEPCLLIASHFTDRSTRLNVSHFNLL